MDCRWVKLNTGWMDSEWLNVLSADARLAWVLVLCHVKAHGLGGRAKAVSPAVFARTNLISEEGVTQMLRAAESNGAIVTEDGCWIVTGWAKHQQDGTAAERQKRYRESKAAVTPVTPVTCDVTPEERRGEEIPILTDRAGAAPAKPAAPAPDAKPAPEADPAGPYAVAARVLSQVADALGWSAPVKPDIMRMISDDSPVRLLVGLYGEDDAVAMFLWAAREWSKPPTWKSVAAQRDQIRAQMRGLKLVPGGAAAPAPKIATPEEIARMAR
jgi:hypothetical protein